MLYSCIEIRKRPWHKKIKDMWQVSWWDIDGQRENQESVPQSLGFYHYKRRLGVEKAFQELKTKMIQDRLDIIKSLSDEISELQQLQIKVNK